MEERIQLIGGIPVARVAATDGYPLTYTSSNNRISLQVPVWPTISSGVIAPSSTPTKVGDVYLDTTAKKIYFACGVASSADWIIVN